MRIIVGGMAHESNTLNPIITGKDDFVVFRGEQMLAPGYAPGSSSRGIIDALREAGCEIFPVLQARAVPNGVISSSFYNELKEEFIGRLNEIKAAGNVDGICLALHGSMKVEGIGCAEEDLVKAIRAVYPDLPITAALDMHATITPNLLKGVNGFAGYKTAPHVDCDETGKRAAMMLLKSLSEKKTIGTVSCKIPMLIAGEKSETAVNPMAELMDACRKAETETHIEAASILLGFPWADNEHNAVTALVSFVSTADEETTVRKKAEEIALKLAEDFWNRRKEFKFRSEYYETKTALDTALKYAQQGLKPVFISDSGDNPTAGAAGDSTDLLEAMLNEIERIDKLPTPLLYSGFYDAPLAAACVSAGEGAEVESTIGGNWDTLNGKKIPLKLKVEKIVRNYGSYNSDLVLISFRNFRITVTSKHIGFGDENLLPALGIDARDYCLVAVKLGYLEACFMEIAAKAVMATTKGCSNEVLETIPYKKLKRPLYPLDPEMEWHASIG